MTTPVAPVAGSDSQLEAIVQRIFNAPNYRKEIEKTVKRNLKLLARNEALEKEVADFKLANPDGAKALTKDQLADYTAFAALNVKPADMKVVLEEHGRLKAKDLELTEEKRYAEAAELLDFENVPALTRWLKREGLFLDFKDVRIEDEETGKKKTVRMPVVRPKSDEKAALEPLDEYMEREVPEFIDTFKAAVSADEEDEDQGGENEDDDENVEIARVQAEAASRIRGGVKIAATRSADRSSSGSKDKKKVERMEKTARESGMYSL